MEPETESVTPGLTVKEWKYIVPLATEFTDTTQSPLDGHELPEIEAALIVPPAPPVATMEPVETGRGVAAVAVSVGESVAEAPEGWEEVTGAVVNAGDEPTAAGGIGVEIISTATGVGVGVTSTKFFCSTGEVWVTKPEPKAMAKG